MTLAALDGTPLYRVQADEHVGFVDGWNEWTGGVALFLYEQDGASTSEPTVVTGERMRTHRGDEGFDRVRVVDDVKVTLPGGSEFLTRRLDYDAASGSVTNCSRNTLLHAGLQIKSDCLRFRQSRSHLRLWGNVALRSADGDTSGGMPSELQGKAEELNTDASASQVSLVGDPVIHLTDSSMQGDYLRLKLEGSGRSLQAIEALGEARMALRGGSSGSVTNVLRAAVVEATFDGEGKPDAVEARVAGTELARWTIEEVGKLQAEKISIVPLDSERQKIVASGATRWESAAGSSGLEYLEARDLALTVDAGGLQLVEAEGEVSASFADGSASAGRHFSGPQLLLGWEEGGLTTGRWPQGVSLSSGLAKLEAGNAGWDPESASWRLDGDPRPRLVSDSYTIEAAALGFGEGGSLSGSGGVRAQLMATELTVLAALFGGAREVQVSAEHLLVDDENELEFADSVRAWWEDQLLLADTLRLGAEPQRLEASGQVFARLQRPADPLTANLGVTEEGTLDSGQTIEDDPTTQEREARSSESGSQEELEGGQFVLLTAGSLLVEGEPTVVHIADEAMLDEGERKIRGASLTLAMNEEGLWTTVEAQGGVVFEDPEGTAEGLSLSYDPQTDEVMLRGDTTTPATFVGREGIETQSVEALKLSWRTETVVIEATEEGRTRTRFAPRQTETTG